MALASNPVFANVAVMRIADFESRSVADQAARKEQLERATREALAGIGKDDRVVLDADDGLAVVVFGDPARALRLAQSVCDPGELQGGVNHGPLALTSRGSDARVFGDGLAAAFAAARFATPGQVLVTRDFAQVLARRNPERAAELASAGEFTDTRVRQHKFYTPDARRGAIHRRRMVAYAIGGALAILLLGVGAREAKVRLIPPSPAIVTFNVKPRGEVVVDGMVRGRIPVLKTLEIPPGKHLLQIHSSPAPVFELALELKAGEQRTITHTFVYPQPKKPAEPPKQDFWKDLKKRFS